MCRVLYTSSKGSGIHKALRSVRKRWGRGVDTCLSRDVIFAHGGKLLVCLFVFGSLSLVQYKKSSIISLEGTRVSCL